MPSRRHAQQAPRVTLRGKRELATRLDRALAERRGYALELAAHAEDALETPDDDDDAEGDGCVGDVEDEELPDADEVDDVTVRQTVDDVAEGAPCDRPKADLYERRAAQSGLQEVRENPDDRQRQQHQEGRPLPEEPHRSVPVLHVNEPKNAGNNRSSLVRQERGGDRAFRKEIGYRDEREGNRDAVKRCLG